MKKMLAAFVSLLFLCVAGPAFADNCSPFTYNFVNGQTIDAGQIMSNYNNLLNCSNNNLAHSGVNADITQLTGLTSPAAAVAITAWTPVLTFATPGNLAVVYSTQTGSVAQVAGIGGNVCYAVFNVITTTFTFTTASGNFQVTGLTPTPSGSFQSQAAGALGLNNAGITSTVRPTVVIGGGGILELDAWGSGLLTTANFSTGSNVTLRGSITYRC